VLSHLGEFPDAHSFRVVMDSQRVVSREASMRVAGVGPVAGPASPPPRRRSAWPTTPSTVSSPTPTPAIRPPALRLSEELETGMVGINRDVMSNPSDSVTWLAGSRRPRVFSTQAPALSGPVTPCSSVS
jgi:hypothetical protein